MKTYKIILLIFALFFSLQSKAQQQNTQIIFKDTEILSPKVFDFGTVNALTYQKFTLINKRKTPVIIKNIKTPTGFFTTIPDTIIQPGKKINIFIGLDPSFTEIKGEFEKKLIIITNLIMNVEITLKGKIETE